jgi:hypothetical protein
VAASSAVFILASGALNQLCLRLAPLALGLVFFYSFTKRFTSFSHLVLGFSLGIAPAAAWIAVRGSLDPRILWLTAAVTFWTAGFDVIYGGIRLSVPEIVQSAIEEDASVVGLHALDESCAHRSAVEDVSLGQQRSFGRDPGHGALEHGVFENEVDDHSAGQAFGQRHDALGMLVPGQRFCRDGAARRLAQAPAAPVKRKGRIKQSVSRWCYQQIPLDELCAKSAQMGLKAIDLLNSDEFEVPRLYGLICSMGRSSSSGVGGPSPRSGGTTNTPTTPGIGTPG